MDGGYPVDITEDLGELCGMAQHNEYEEHDVVYQQFGDKAKEEGFSGVANSFYKIAEIEKSWNSVGKFAQWLEENKLHVADVKRSWICLNYGAVSEGERSPQVCPVCHHDQGYFMRVELAPFA